MSVKSDKSIVNTEWIESVNTEWIESYTPAKNVINI